MSTVWIDAQISPVIAKWMNDNFSILAIPIRDLGLLNSSDLEIFNEAKRQKVIVMTKDIDFIRLQEKYGPPPYILWITCGNTSNISMKQILNKNLVKALNLFDSGEILVEINIR
jgi:predicted nuclease of predicted toxin-antitoxin system